MTSNFNLLFCVQLVDKMKLLQKNKNHLILYILIWLIFIAVFYIIAIIKINKAEKIIHQFGVKEIQMFSKSISLPLLEVDISTLRTLLNGFIDSNSEVIYTTAIIDHKNNVVAYMGVELMEFIEKAQTDAVERVSFWEGDSSDCKKIINFSSDVTYAGTKIGKICMTVSTAEINRFKIFFGFGVFVSFAILLLVTIWRLLKN